MPNGVFPEAEYRRLVAEKLLALAQQCQDESVPLVEIVLETEEIHYWVAFWDPSLPVYA